MTRFKLIKPRLSGFDYSSPGLYFITITTKDLKHYFGTVKNGKVRLSGAGKILKTQIEQLPQHYRQMSIDIYTIMPNHFHAIINIGETEPDKTDENRQSMLLSRTLGSLKKFTSRDIHNIGINDFAWHRSFHDHVIRSEKAYKRIYEYIALNPENWGRER